MGLILVISPYPIGPFLHTRRMRAQLATALKNESFDLAFFHLSQGDLAGLEEMQPHINAPLILLQEGRVGLFLGYKHLPAARTLHHPPSEKAGIVVVRL